MHGPLNDSCASLTRVKRGLKALQDFAPTVLVVWPESFVELQYNVWESYFRNSKHRIAILARHNSGNQLPASSVPIFFEDESDITFREVGRIASLKVILYPTHRQRIRKAINAFALKRNVFIGHGDSDKASSARGYHRIFDRIFVADQRARERYKSERFRDDKFAIIGAPFPKGIVSDDVPRPVTNVLYAPTWEGNQSDNRFTSICDLDQALTKKPKLTEGYSLNVLPHPLAGTRDIKVQQSLDNISHQHGWERQRDKAQAFNESDAIVTDISGVLSEYLATRKPIVVVGLESRTFTDAWESSILSSVASLWDPFSETLDTALDRARSKSISDARVELADSKFRGATSPEQAWAAFDSAIDNEILQMSIRTPSNYLRTARKRIYKLNPVTAAKAVARFILRRPSRPVS